MRPIREVSSFQSRGCNGVPENVLVLKKSYIDMRFSRSLASTLIACTGSARHPLTDLYPSSFIPHHPGHSGKGGKLIGRYLGVDAGQVGQQSGLPD